MEHLRLKETKGDVRSTSFRGDDTLASRELSHSANRTEEVRTERGLAEGQRSDRTNALANKAAPYNHWDYPELEALTEPSEY